jgi:hypothetical protein
LADARAREAELLRDVGLVPEEPAVDGTLNVMRQCQHACDSGRTSNMFGLGHQGRVEQRQPPAAMRSLERASENASIGVRLAALDSCFQC